MEKEQPIESSGKRPKIELQSGESSASKKVIEIIEASMIAQEESLEWEKKKKSKPWGTPTFMSRQKSYELTKRQGALVREKQEEPRETGDMA